MKVWITKYALKTGISEVDGIYDEKYSDYLVVNTEYGELFYRGKEWHKTKAGAIEHANIMKANKLDSLRMQIAKLEAMEFK